MSKSFGFYLSNSKDSKDWESRNHIRTVCCYQNSPNNCAVTEFILIFSKTFCDEETEGYTEVLQLGGIMTTSSRLTDVIILKVRSIGASQWLIICTE